MRVRRRVGPHYQVRCVQCLRWFKGSLTLGEIGWLRRGWVHYRCEACSNRRD